MVTLALWVLDHLRTKQPPIRRLRSCDSFAILLMHGWAFSAHERQLAAIARRIGFTQVSVSYGFLDREHKPHQQTIRADVEPA